MNNMGPRSDYNELYVMKSSQLGFTAASENIIAYYIDECPTQILFVTATEYLVKKWARKRLAPLIDSCGIRHKIFAQTDNKKSRQSGDTLGFKEFAGGGLSMTSSRSAAGLRSDSVQVLILDEIDGSPSELLTGEGNWLDVSLARTQAYGDRKKILALSTPTTYFESQINLLYESGDQRKFLVPCPFCGKMQELRFGDDSTQYGLRPIREAGVLVDVYYECEFCHDAIFNHQKPQILNKGRWVPSAKDRGAVLSYHISSLYSPVGMLSWLALYKLYEKAQKRPDGMGTFKNLYLGVPSKQEGSKPDIGKVIELRGDYRAGRVPGGVLYLTVGVDVQRGSKKDEKNPPRLELEVLGTCAGYRTASIDYKIFIGEVDDPYGGAWEDLYKWAEDGGLVYENKQGQEFHVKMVFIDSGYNPDVVYEFCSRWEHTYPSKGFSLLKRRKGESIDLAGSNLRKRYRPVKLASDLILYEISTLYFKNRVYNNLKIKKREMGKQPPGFCAFPIDYGENYFKQLTAEEKKTDGTFSCPSGRRNEALDCRVMALCAAVVYLDSYVSDIRAGVKSRGGGPVELQQITYRSVIDNLEKLMYPDGGGEK
jgi:phage terminase large subunit GpA-like protein